jgi:2Fe-2S ferredoxin
MPTVHFIHPEKNGQQATQSLVCKPGQSLMQAAVDAGLAGIAADCGGTLTCATCHVWVQPPWAERLPPATPDEVSMLEFTASPRQPGSRLSCQVTLSEELDGLTVALPPSQY